MTRNVGPSHRFDERGKVPHLRARAADHVGLAVLRGPKELIDEVPDEVDLLRRNSESFDGKGSLDGAPCDDGVQAVAAGEHRRANAGSRKPVTHHDVRLRGPQESVQRHHRERKTLTPCDDDVVFVPSPPQLHGELHPAGKGSPNRPWRGRVQDRLVVPLCKEIHRRDAFAAPWRPVSSRGGRPELRPWAARTIRRVVTGAIASSCPTEYYDRFRR